MSQENPSSLPTWETVFPDERKRDAVKRFVRSVSSLERLGRLLLVREQDGPDKIYAFFPDTNLTADEMAKLGNSLDEAFNEIDPHDWPVPIEMSEMQYKEFRRNSGIKVKEEIILWEREQRRDMNIPAMLAPLIGL